MATDAATPALAVEDVGYAYGERQALAGVCLDVAAGERFGILAPNGGGKTTLLRIISTLLPPAVGRVRVMGHDVTTEPLAVRRRLGVVFQDAALDPELTVRENLAVQAALVGLDRPTGRVRADALIQMFGIADRAKDRVGRLSGGLARRADLVRGMLHRPPLLLLDEPTAGLDPLARRELWDALDGARAPEENGVPPTQIVATHLMEEADLCDRVAILDRGRVVAQGAPHELRAALGSSVLWLDSDQPDRLASLISSLETPARVIGRRVLVGATEPARLLPQIYEVAGEAVAGATMRKPTLEDVFLAATGRMMGDAGEGGGTGGEGGGRAAASLSPARRRGEREVSR